MKMRATWIGLGWGILIGSSPFFEPLEFKVQWTLGLGLFFSYFTVGVLLDLIPLPVWARSIWGRLLWGSVVGVGFSLAGAFFTLVPYPLAADAPDYFKEFASGNGGTFVATLVIGGIVGATAGLGVGKTKS